MVVDGYFKGKVEAAGVDTVALGTVEQYEHVLEDAKLRLASPKTLIHMMLTRLPEHFRILETLVSGSPGRMTVVVGGATRRHAANAAPPVLRMQSQHAYELRCSRTGDSNPCSRVDDVVALRRRGGSCSSAA